jgi:hypothetical protein
VSGSLAAQPPNLPAHSPGSLLLRPGICFAATRETDGTWSVQFAGFNATGLADWQSLEDYIFEMLE